ncbi:MAG TPA: hypothetical protein VE907_01865 [Gammaproteobacteria bacterium]|nr:hypothetical protein [Gammaproteobacteria bacterium]
MPDPSLGQDVASADSGKQVFQYWCAPCHAPGPRHPGTQALDALYKGAKPEISDAELAALAAYLAPRAR